MTFGEGEIKLSIDVSTFGLKCHFIFHQLDFKFDTASSEAYTESNNGKKLEQDPHFLNCLKLKDLIADSVTTLS